MCFTRWELGDQKRQIFEGRSAEAADLKFQLLGYEVIKNYPIEKIIESAENPCQYLSYDTLKWEIV